MSEDRTGERIAKVIARSGLCSRRDAERLIEEGRVTLNGKRLQTAAVNVTGKDRVAVDGTPLPKAEGVRLWRYYKPKGRVTTHRDPEGRPTVFEALPEDMPRVISVGRLDFNTEGLLLLTNDGTLARHLESPSTGWLRRYRVRANGAVTQADLDKLAGGLEVDGIRYGPIEAKLDRVQGANVWVTIAIREGKNREVRRIMEHLGLAVNRLIRLSFGPFALGELEAGQIEEVRRRVLADQLGPEMAARLGLTERRQDRARSTVEKEAGGMAEPKAAGRKRKAGATPAGARARRSGPDRSPEERSVRTGPAAARGQAALTRADRARTGPAGQDRGRAGRGKAPAGGRPPGRADDVEARAGRIGARRTRTGPSEAGRASAELTDRAPARTGRTRPGEDSSGPTSRGRGQSRPEDIADRRMRYSPHAAKARSAGAGEDGTSSLRRRARAANGETAQGAATAFGGKRPEMAGRTGRAEKRTVKTGPRDRAPDERRSAKGAQGKTHSKGRDSPRAQGSSRAEKHWRAAPEGSGGTSTGHRRRGPSGSAGPRPRRPKS